MRIFYWAIGFYLCNNLEKDFVHFNFTLQIPTPKHDLIKNNLYKITMRERERERVNANKNNLRIALKQLSRFYFQ